eukprot:TRINITY_DN3802_c0_g3_i2.p1 TRINITY_DN3802_c0_g3~~TRINITY_DN3802_c0_g3_i2.p1  ORF type:complete len:582 (+),score=106.76 TRINITY_DN3802_c0_g3_i2:45-1790(+)
MKKTLSSTPPAPSALQNQDPNPSFTSDTHTGHINTYSQLHTHRLSNARQHRASLQITPSWWLQGQTEISSQISPQNSSQISPQNSSQISTQNSSQIRLEIRPEVEASRKARVWCGEWTLTSTRRKATGKIFNPVGYSLSEPANPYAIVHVLESPISASHRPLREFALHLAMAGFRLFLVPWQGDVDEMLEVSATLVRMASVDHIPNFICGFGAGALVAAKISNYSSFQKHSRDDNDDVESFPDSRLSSVSIRDILPPNLASISDPGNTSLSPSKASDDMNGLGNDSMNSSHETLPDSPLQLSKDLVSGLCGLQLGSLFSDSGSVIDLPIHGLCMISPWFRLPGEPLSWRVASTKAANEFLQQDISFPISQLQALHFTRDPTIAQSLRMDWLVSKASISNRTLRETAKLAADVRESISTTSVALLTIHGQNDQFACSAASAEVHMQHGSADKTLHIWPGVCHDVLLDNETVNITHSVVLWILSQCRQLCQNGRLDDPYNIPHRDKVRWITRETSTNTYSSRSQKTTSSSSHLRNGAETIPLQIASKTNPTNKGHNLDSKEVPQTKSDQISAAKWRSFVPFAS